MLLAAVSFAACNPDEAKESPAVSFETALPVMADGSATFKIVVNNYTGTDPVTIPVIFGGTAVKGEDYSVSAEEFVYGGETPVTAITVTALKYGTGKTVSLTLGLPEGWIGGNYTMSEYELSGKLGYLSFERKTQLMTDRVIASLNIFDANGAPKALVNGDEITVSVNTEKSTAIEGTDFKFADDKKAVVIAAGASTGDITLELIGDELAEGHDKIVLTFSAGDKYELGQYFETEITIVGSEWKKFNGKWVLNEFLTDAEYIKSEMWLTDDDMVGFPAVAEGDALTIDVEAGLFKPEFTSDFKNFFIGESNIKKADPYQIMAGMGDRRMLQMLELDNTNRNFSANSQSEDKVSYVGARIIVDETTNEELLDLYLLDYLPTDFLSIYFDYGMFNETKPTATTTCVFLNLTFKKVVE